MLKLYICWPYTKSMRVSGETMEFYLAFKKNQNVKVVYTFEEADFIIYLMDVRNCWNLKPKGMKLDMNVVRQIKNYHRHDREIVIDYNDWTDLRNIEEDLIDKIFLYFKRSMIDKGSKSLISYNREVKLISYAVRSDFVKYDEMIGTPGLEYDICCMFNLGNKKRSNREKIPHIVNEYEGKKHIGLVTGDRFSRRYMDVITEYYDIMKKSRIIVTANPPNWEGDFRLWEAMLTGNLVMCDRMVGMDLLEYPLIHKKHIIFYNNMDDLRNLIKYYTINEKESREIGREGREYVLKHHLFSNRADYVIKTIYEKLLSIHSSQST